MDKINDFKDKPEVRAYVLYVFARWKYSGEIEHQKTDYLKRLPDEIKKMENVRMFLHKQAIEFLTANGFKEKEIFEFLEKECELETKRQLLDLKEGENYCGCCRMIVKTKLRKIHEKSRLHCMLLDRFYELHQLYSKMKILMMMDKAKEKQCVKSVPSEQKEKA